MEGLRRFLNSMSDTVNLYDGSLPKGKVKKQKLYPGCNYRDEPIIIIQWSEKGRGFGEYVFYEKDGKLYCNNECDSKETVKRILCRLVDKAIFTEEVSKKQIAEALGATKIIKSKIKGYPLDWITVPEELRKSPSKKQLKQNYKRYEKVLKKE